MDKEQTILFIKDQLATGKITQADLLSLREKTHPSWNIINTMYVIGAIIVLTGVVILTYQHWTEIGFAGRITVTMGLALVSYIVALLLNRSPQKMMSQVMFTIAAILAPLGVYVLLHEMGISFNSLNQAIAAMVLLVVFAVAQLIARNNILVIVLVGFATWAYYSFLFHIFSAQSYDADWLKWASLILGFSYLLIAYSYQSIIGSANQASGKEAKAVANVLYALGTLAILGSAISFGGIWDLILILLIFGAFYLSVYVRSQAMLFLGALFLMAHVIKLTSKYFLNSIGWPVALIVCGFLVIGIGYLTFKLNRRYISSLQ